MIYKLIEDTNGDWTDGTNNYSILEAQYDIIMADETNVDCIEFDSIEQAEEFYKVYKIDKNE